jgi:hypothetical protein
MTRSVETAVCLVMAILLCCFTWGCDKTKCTGSDSTGPTGQLTSSTGCKTWAMDADTDTMSSSQDCIKWDYDGKGHLGFTHVNAGFNCCPKFEAVTYVEGGTIYVVEHEIEGLCDCICLFDLAYEIDGLEPGVYRMTVTQECLREGDDPLDFTMDLIGSPSGHYCVERNHYPWGTW